MANFSKPYRLWRIVLVVSLALNVAVIGGVAGLAISGRAADGPPQRFLFDFGPLGRVLDSEDRRAIGHAMRRDGAKPFSRDEMKEKVSGLAAALRAEPFDVAAVEVLFVDFRSRSERVQQDAQEAFVAQLSAMSVEARTRLADRLERGTRK